MAAPKNTAMPRTAAFTTSASLNITLLAMMTRPTRIDDGCTHSAAVGEVGKLYEMSREAAVAQESLIQLQRNRIRIAGHSPHLGAAWNSGDDVVLIAAERSQELLRRPVRDGQR